MNKNNIRLGLMWVSGLCAGVIVGGFANEKLNQKYLQPSIDRYRKLAENFGELLKEEYVKNEILQKEVLRMKREEASEK